MTKADKDALERALTMCRAEPDRAEQIASMLADRSWWDVATFAAYHCQNRALKLKPWEDPPCFVEPDDLEHPQAVKLLKEMLAAGVSRWDPDPLAAIAQAKQVQA